MAPRPDLASTRAVRFVRAADGEKTVRNQISAIFDQMAVTSRSQAIVRAREAGYGRRRSEPT